MLSLQCEAVSDIRLVKSFQWTLTDSLTGTVEALAPSSSISILTGNVTELASYSKLHANVSRAGQFGYTCLAMLIHPRDSNVEAADTTSITVKGMYVCYKLLKWCMHALRF